jgi:methyl-accepting chemotaxis protein
MLNPFSSRRSQARDASRAADIVKAIDASQAMIEFAMDGTVLSANGNFLRMLGYSFDEIRGKPHAIFVESGERDSADYRRFWDKLRSGQPDGGRRKRIGKDGKEIWLRASYNPVLGADGKPYKVVTLAADISAQKELEADLSGRLAAVSRVMAVIEFDLSGTILRANETFLKVVGYAADEIEGRHHRMFVDADHAASADYREFWDRLARGEIDTGQYKALGKGGHEIWLQASYNPVFDANGRPCKVVAFATDITASVLANRTLQRAAMAVIDAAEKNDLTRRISLEGQSGEIAALCTGVNTMLDSMAAVIGKISSVAKEVANASSEISAGATDLSHRTEEQAASLEQTSASMEEIAKTVKRNADGAQEANRSANDALAIADKGGQVVGEAVQAMARIEGSSRKISDIIGVIDEIARQTNLLALNAAVEAARAGDAGRGFAVVASEVRSLAQRSSQAAKDIKDLIVNSNEEVRQGVGLVNKAGSALHEIVAAIKSVAGGAAAIANASMEQATSVEQVNKALGHMDEATQQNSALVEENAATAKALEQHAARMAAEVNAFTIEAREQKPVPGRPLAAVKPPRAAAAPKPRNGHTGARAVQGALARAVEQSEWKDF